MDASFGVKKWEHIPGTVLHEYLTQYAKHFGLFDRIRFNTWVDTAEEITQSMPSSTWLLSARIYGEPVQFRAHRLVLATGMTSKPAMPVLPQASAFQGQILHFKDLGSFAKNLSSATSNVRSAVILGSSKLAWDAAYLCAKAGAKAHLIIRKSGNGAHWFCKSYATPLKTWVEKLLMRRAVTWFSPCIWGDADGYAWVRSMLHGTVLGRMAVNGFWTMIGSDMLDGMSFAKHPETAKLIPTTSPFWHGSNLSIDNYDTDFLELVRNGKIVVHLADVENLEEYTVCLSDGETVAADAIICCTGWDSSPTITFRGSCTPEQLGMPHYSEGKDPIVSRADEEIFARFPKLSDQPIQAPLASSNLEAYTRTVPLQRKINQPFRLYKGMVPPAFVEKRNFAYAGNVWAIAGANMWHIQALWMSAFFDAKLPLPSQTEIEYETVLYSQWGKWRTPLSAGAVHLDVSIDALPYLDTLLEQLGLRRWRKGGMLRELVVAYGQEDYKNIVGEWLAANTENPMQKS